MIEARINLGVLNTTRRRIRIRMNQFDSARGIRNTPRACDARVFRGEDAHVVITCIGSGCTSEDELMGGKTWALIGLEHIVCPPILGRKRQVRVQNPVPTGIRVLNESELRLTRTRADAGDVACPVHSACPWWICVALAVKSSV